MPSSAPDSCLIPCPEARSLIATSKPISKSLLSVRSPKQISLLKNSLQSDYTLIKFDGVLDDSISQSKLFNTWIKSSTQDLLTGKSMSVIVFGTTGSGKSYTVRGGEGKKRGQALRTVELLLSFVEKLRGRVSICVSVVGLIEDKTVDLLSRQTPVSETQIQKSSDFHAALNQALKTRKSLVDKQNKDKIHMVVSVKLFQDGEKLSQANFVELAGSEYAREDKFIARGFNAISCLLTNTYSNWQFNPLASYLKPCVNLHGPAPVNVLLICCSSSDFSNFPDTLTSLKFISRIKECLEKEAARPELIQLDNLIFSLASNKLQELEILLEHLESTVRRIAQTEKPLRQSENRRSFFRDLENEDTRKPRDELQDKRLLSELNSLKVKYSQLQEQYSAVLEEKSQLTTSFAIFQSQVIDDLLGQCQDLNKKFKEEQEVREKLLADVKAFRKALLSKADKDHECLCSEDLKRLQKVIQDVNEERAKLTEKLESCLKDSIMKEDYIQALNSTSASYEQETQHLTSIVSEYESLIYDLRKSLNFMSSKLGQIEEEKLSLLSENEKLRSSFKSLKDKIEDQQLRTQSDIESYKAEHEHISAKYEKLIEKTESLTLELTKSKLTNSHLAIQNKALSADLQSVNLGLIDKQVSSVYASLDSLQELLARPRASHEP